MAQRTAEDVANMESELIDLRHLNEDLKQRLVASETERKILRIANELLKFKSDENLTKATKVETIMRQVAAGLMAGIKEMNEEKELARAVQRQVQEDQLGVGDDRDRPPGAIFKAAQREYERQQVEGAHTDRHTSQTPNHEEIEPQPRLVRVPLADEARADQLRGAAEHIARHAPLRTGRVDTTLADRDDRLPRYEYSSTDGRPAPRRVETDEESLRRLANDMGGARAR